MTKWHKLVALLVKCMNMMGVLGTLGPPKSGVG